ncbi:MAG: alginate export family protein, partial [Thermodesulfovibrionales bacterium]
LHVGLLTIKFSEGSKTNNHDDIDGYVGLFTYKLDAKNTIGANYTYLNSNLGVPAGATSVPGLPAGAYGLGSGLKMSNVGVHANGNVSGLGYKAEADFQFGDVTTDVKAKGYAAMVGLSYTVDPATIRASAALGSGHHGGDAKEFITFLDDGVLSGKNGDPHYTLVYEYQVNSTSGRRFSGLANTTYFNIGADFTPVKDLKTSLDAFFIRATEQNSNYTDTGSKNAGWEVDGKVVYNVAKNLVYQVDAGYFKAGKFYEDKKGVTVLRHQLTLIF